MQVKGDFLSKFCDNINNRLKVCETSTWLDFIVILHILCQFRMFFISQGSVETSLKYDEKLYMSFVENFLLCQH